MTSRRCSRSSADGFTLVEMLVGMTVMLFVTGAALSLGLSTRGIYEADQARTRLQQSARAAKDFLSADLRQAGERLAGNFPALEVVPGTAGAPDELVLRRNLVSTVMNSCRDVNGTVQLIYIAELFLPVPPGCDPLPDGDADGWPDDHKIWADYREANGEPLTTSEWVWAYLYNPVTQLGEFFRYWDDVPNDGVIMTAPGQTWTHDYPLADRPRVYVLEQRRYRLAADTLQMVLNGDTAAPVNLVDGVDDFQLLAHFQSKPLQDSLDATDDWTDLRAIEIAVQSSAVVRDEAYEHAWSTLILPRNVLSR